MSMKRSILSMVVAVVVAALALAGCSSSGSKSPGSTSPAGGGSSAAASTSATASGYTATAEATVQAGYAGLYKDPPTGGPGVRAGTSKSLYVIPCSTAIYGCNAPATGIREAAKALGWKVTLLSGNASPTGYTAALRQAVAAKPDGILTIGLDCEFAKAGLQAAKSAGIPTVGVYSFDCNDPKIKAGPSLYTTTESPDPVLWGKLRADAAIAGTKGKAQIIQIRQPDFTFHQYSDASFDAEISKCSGCKIVDKVNISAADEATATTVSQKVSSALQQNPSANVLQTGSDTILQDSAQAIVAAHRTGLDVIAGEGYPLTLNLVRTGKASIAVGIPTDWIGWAGVDKMWRILGGAKTFPDEGANYEFIDKDHNLPPAGQPWTPKIDFQSLYTKNWKSFTG